MGGYDIGASASTSSGAQAGNAQSGVGDFNVTFSSNRGSSLASLLPTVPASQSWIVWAVLGVVAIAGLILFLRKP